MPGIATNLCRRRTHILAAAATVQAQESAVRLDDLVRTGLERNPRLKALGHVAEAQKFRIAPEKALPDPVLSFGIKNMGIDRWTVGEEVNERLAH